VIPTETGVPTTVRTLNPGIGKILAYPNPAQRQVTLLIGCDGSDPVDVRIYNLAGEMACKTSVQPANGLALAKLNCSSLASGIYLVRVSRPGSEIAKCKIAVSK
jgi:hypothetical protein